MAEPVLSINFYKAKPVIQQNLKAWFVPLKYNTQYFSFMKQWKMNLLFVLTELLKIKNSKYSIFLHFNFVSVSADNTDKSQQFLKYRISLQGSPVCSNEVPRVKVTPVWDKGKISSQMKRNKRKLNLKTFCSFWTQEYLQYTNTVRISLFYPRYHLHQNR